jgi:Amt family ammonium transporter
LAVFGTATFGGFGVTDMGAQLVLQFKGVGFTVLWSAVGTTLIVLLVKATVGLRVSKETENTGLDQAEHGETAYHLD